MTNSFIANAKPNCGDDPLTSMSKFETYEADLSSLHNQILEMEQKEKKTRMYLVSVLKREMQRIEKECFEEENECRRHIEDQVYIQNSFKNCIDGLEGI